MSGRRRLCCLISFLLCAHFSPALSQTSKSTNEANLPRFVRLEPDTLQASVLEKKDPILPPLPSNLNINTTAVLELIVDERGVVRNVKPISVHPRLQDEAVRAARQWKFSPPREGGKPVIAIGSVTLNFVPANSPAEHEGIENARNAAKQNPKDPHPHYLLAKLYDGAGRYEEAVEALKPALSLKPDFEEASILLGKLYGRLQREDEQISTYKRHLSLNPNSTEVLRLLARLYMDRERYSDAIKVLEELEVLKPIDASVLNEIGEAHARLGRIETAIRFYRKALEIDSNDPTPHHNLGYELFKIKQFKDAETELNRALSLNPSLRTACHHLGELYAVTNRPEKAIEVYENCFKRAHSDFEDLATDYHRLGELRLRLKEFDRAAELLEQALVLIPASPKSIATWGASRRFKTKTSERWSFSGRDFESRKMCRVCIH